LQLLEASTYSSW